MARHESPYCPECDDAFDYPEPQPADRRAFLGAALATTAAASLTGTARAAAPAAETPAPRKPRPAEEMVRELVASLKDDQKKRVVLPFDHGAKTDKAGKLVGRPTRMGMYNAAALGVKIGDVYTKAQQELLENIVKSLSSGDDGYRQISRGGNWDASKTFANCGALVFGDVTPGKPFAFLFSGHHLTIRCDGDSVDGPAFGGPIYYGHSVQGYSRGNFFNYQTRSVQKLYKALSGKQQEAATVKKGNPGEMDGSIKFKAKAEDRPGIRAEDLSRDQNALVEEVMRSILKPYRQADVDEVMAIIKKNGGMGKIQLAFYPDNSMKDDEPWHFWRLEGPGFVWNYRVLDHVHTYVNISSKLA